MTNNNKVVELVEWNDLFLNEEWSIMDAMDNVMNDVMSGMYDPYIKKIKEVKAAINDGSLLDWIDNNPLDGGEYLNEKINNEQWNVLYEYAKENKWTLVHDKANVMMEEIEDVLDDLNIDLGFEPCWSIDDWHELLNQPAHDRAKEVDQLNMVHG